MGHGTKRIKEVTNRFKGLDLIDRVPEELWIELSAEELMLLNCGVGEDS